MAILRDKHLWKFFLKIDSKWKIMIFMNYVLYCILHSYQNRIRILGLNRIHMTFYWIPFYADISNFIWNWYQFVKKGRKDSINSLAVSWIKITLDIIVIAVCFFQADELGRGKDWFWIMHLRRDSGHYIMIT